MITREELVEIAIAVQWGLSTPSLMNMILDAVEPLIRIDQAERIASRLEVYDYFDGDKAAQIARDTKIR